MVVGLGIKNYLYKNYTVMKITKEIEELFQSVRRALGAPVRAVELTDDQLCDLLNFAIGDYAEKVENEVIDNNWMSFYGKYSADSNALVQGFMFRTLDLSKDYSYWFSKQVGLQQEGPWELKKDFIKIEAGKQVYVVPSGRTINKVMWLNPSMTDTALFGNSMIGAGLGVLPGMGPIGFPAGYGRGSGFYTTQVADVAYTAADLNFKRSLFSSDLVYKVTAGPDGTHLIHLMSTPGSRLSFGFAGLQNNVYGLVDCELWYTYYDTVSQEDADECARFHSDDVILRPDQVQVGNIDYSLLNNPTKTIVRQLLIAKAKQTLGLIRGKYSGKVSIPQAEMVMDYQMLNQQGIDEYKTVMETLTKRLERLRPSNMMKEHAELVESTVNIQKYTPLKIYTVS